QLPSHEGDGVACTRCPDSGSERVAWSCVRRDDGPDLPPCDRVELFAVPRLSGCPSACDTPASLVSSGSGRSRSLSAHRTPSPEPAHHIRTRTGTHLPCHGTYEVGSGLPRN